MHRFLRSLAIIAGIGLTSTVALAFRLPLLEAARIGFGAPFLLLVPGLAWSLALFPGQEVDALERAVLSFGFSIATVPLSVFVANRLGLTINALTILILSLVITAAALIVAAVRARRAAASAQPSGHS